jgi:hypothetical protein
LSFLGLIKARGVGGENTGIIYLWIGGKMDYRSWLIVEITYFFATIMKILQIEE